MRNYQPKTCNNCGTDYTPTGQNQKVCSDCKLSVDQARRLPYSRLYYTLNYRTGQGSGGNQRSENNHQWKGGISPQNYRAVKLNSDPRRACERCDKDLSKFVGVKVFRGMWTVHHKDGNDENWVLENLELLCKRCHQIEHHCEQNLNAKV